MFNKTFAYTTLFSSLFMVFMLKFLHLFSFIKWSPIGWEKKWSAFSSVHDLVKWAILFLLLILVFAALYILTSFLESVSPAVLAIVISVIGMIAVEWLISEPKTPFEVIQSMSIPLLSVTAITLRFIAGTAIFFKELSRKV